MMRWIIGSSLQFRLLVVVIAAVMMFFGITRLRDMPVDVLPEFSRPYVEIQTEALGLSAEEMEAMITTPMEADMLNGAAWVQEIRSESVPGLSSIRLYFEPGTDIMDARQMTQERLMEVYALPSVSKPPTMLQPVSSTARCMKIGLSSENMSLIKMSVLARWTIRPRLMGVPGVANVSIWGQRERQLQVQVDPKRLHDNGVTLNQIISTTGNSLWASPLTFLDAAMPGTGGFIDTPNQRLTIQHVFPISSAEQLAEVPIDGMKGIRLGDVANVVEDHQPLIGDAVVNDAPALMLVVEKFPWANTLDVTQGVESALAKLRPAVSGLEMDSSLFRPATFIKIAMENLAASLLIGGALVALALLAFLSNWRSGLIGTVAIVTSVVVAGLVINVMGASVNMLVLAGLLIALGVVIDDSVVCTQNIIRRLQQYRSQGGSDGSLAWIVREATVEMQGVLLYATMIILLTLAPVIFMEGISAAFYQPLIFAYALAIVCSLAVALIVTPVLAVLLFRNAPLGADQTMLAASLQRIYDETLGRLMLKTGPVFAVAAALIVVGGALLLQVRQESLFPKFKELNLVVSLDGKPGMSHPAMSRNLSKLSGELRKISGVKNVSGQIGRAITSDSIADVDSSEMWLSLDPTADYDATVAEVKSIVAGYTDFDRDVETYLDEQVTEALQGEERGLVVRVYGDDLKIIRSKAEEILSRLAKIDGVVNPEIEAWDEAPRIEIEPNLEQCKAHGIKPGDVRRQASVLLSGIEVGNLFEEQKVFEVVVWGVPEIRDSVENVRDLLIESQLGNPIRLEEVADVRIVTGPTAISHEAVARYVDVSADVLGRDLAAVGNDVNESLALIEFPLEYRAELLGEAALRLATQRRVTAFAIAAAIAIYLLYQVAFGNWRLAAMMMLMLPLALVGGLVTAYFSGGVLSFGSILGFVAILAIAVRGGVLLVSRYRALALEPSAGEVADELANYQAHYAKSTPLNDGGQFAGEINVALVQQGTKERVVPVVLTAIATALAFAPFVFFGNIQGHEIMHPMAIVILGGLVTTVLVNLCVLPAGYLWLQPHPQADIVTEIPERRQAEVVGS